MGQVRGKLLSHRVLNAYFSDNVWKTLCQVKQVTVLPAQHVVLSTLYLREVRGHVHVITPFRYFLCPASKEGLF